MSFGPAVITPLATPHARLEHYSYREKDEAVPEIQGRELPRQGDELAFRKE